MTTDSTGEADGSSGAVDSTGVSDTSSGGAMPSCGDRIVEGPESCDDANADPHDGCDACERTPALTWEYILDHAGGDDDVTSLAPDGDGVLVGGAVDGGATDVDALWLRVADGDLAPPAWFQTAALVEANGLSTIARNGDACLIGGFVTPTLGTTVASANFVNCTDGALGSDLLFEVSAGPGTEELRASALYPDGRSVVAGWRIRGGVLRGWVAQLDATGFGTEETVWFDDPRVYGNESRVNDLWLGLGTDPLVAGTYVSGGVRRGFAVAASAESGNPFAFGQDAEQSEAVAVVGIPETIVVGGWTIDALGTSTATVQGIPIGRKAPTEWTFGSGTDERVLDIVARPGGIAVTGFTTGEESGRDLFVVWLDDALNEQHRVVFDGPDHGSDVGRAIVWDGNGDDGAVIVGGHTEQGPSTDLLVQRWQPPVG